jgi:hypothetical protein
MTATTIIHPADTSDAPDPTQGLLTPGTSVAERDPTAGASRGVLHDPTSPGTMHAGAIVVPGSHTPNPSTGRKALGHVLGHAIGERLPRPRRDRPVGRVVGHAVGEALPHLRRDRPVGHIVGHALGEAPGPRQLHRPVGHVFGRPITLSTPGVSQR